MRKSCLLAIFFILASPAVFAWTVEGDGIQGWQSRQLVINVNPSGCPISEDTLNEIVDSAIGIWNGIASSSLALERASTASTTTPAEFIAGTATDTPLILCDTAFQSDLSINPANIPAATKLGSHNPIDYGAVILNAQSGAGAEISNFDNNLLTLILAHEIGHLLGLGHSSLQDALMYYSVANKTTVVLTQDDRDGISYLYPSDEFQTGAFGCAAVHSPVTKARVFPAVWFLLMLVLSCGLVRLYFRSKFEPLL